MNRNQKVSLVKSMKEGIFASELFIIFKNKGLKVNEFHSLRADVRKAGGKCVVSKNRLAKIALAENDNGDAMGALFTGPTVVVSSSLNGDIISLVKATVDFCKASDARAEIIGGAMGAQVFSVSDVEKLAALPSFEVLRSILLRTLLTPATNLARVIAETPTSFVRVLKARSES